MGSIIASELTKLLANWPKEDAEKFINEFFQVLLYGLEKDKNVKIKGLGTFKLNKAKLNGDADNSASKYKLTFIPEASMRDAANRAFSQFESVMLNEGVSFDDIVEEECDDFEKAEKQEDSEQNDNYISFVDNLVVAPEQPVDIPQKESASPEIEQTTAAIPQPFEPQKEAEPVNETVQPAVGQTILDEEPKSHNKIWWLVAAACVLGLILFFSLKGRDSQPNVEVATVTAPVDTITKVEEVEQPSSENYDEINAKIPYGAYRIVGVDTVITVTKGLDLDAIARIFLGAEMQVYLVVMNDGNDSPTEGQTYKIPKLELKKQ